MQGSMLECLIVTVYILVGLIVVSTIVALIDPTRYYSELIRELIALVGGIIAAIKLKKGEG